MYTPLCIMIRFPFLHISLTAVLIKDSSILLCASAFRYCNIISFWCIWKNSGYLLIDSYKGRNILIDFLDKCGFSFMILHQNLTSTSFLQVNCNVESENISWIFHVISLNSNGLSCTLNRSFTMHDFLTSCIDQGKYWLTKVII